jgi:outer membrane immunogenic protein
MVKKLLIALIGSALTSCPALAADIAVKTPYYPPSYTWTGCYIDAGGGYGMWNQDHTSSTTFGGVPGTTIENTAGGQGWLGRFGGGCDYQFGNGWVVGALGDYDVMGLNGSMSPLLVTTTPTFPEVANENETGAWYAGARLGYLILPGLLTYVDGGWTGTHFSSMALTTSLGVPLSSGTGFAAHTYNGWFIGSGTEYALNFSWLPIHGLFWRNEYRYSSYGTANLPEVVLATGALSPTGNVLNADKYVQTVTSSLVWRFNWSQP